MIQTIFSDSTINYRTPLEPNIGDTIKVRIRVFEGLDPNFKLVLKSEAVDAKKFDMVFEYTKSGFDYFCKEFTATDGIMSYYFEFEYNDKKYYFNSIGVSDTINEYYNFNIITNYHTPDWAKGAVMYQIFIDRFYNGDNSNDVKTDEYHYMGRKVKGLDWNHDIENLDVDNFHGGDIQGIIDKLDYLAELGVEALYLNPVFVSPSNHKYDTQDYNNIDPHFGKIVVDDGTYKTRTTNIENLNASNKLFSELVDKCHEKNIKVIIDGVFNHCGSFNKWMDSYGIYGVDTLKNQDGEYRKYFNFDKEGNYETWWNNDTLPKLNYENSPELIQEIYKVAKKWIDFPYNVDGWRLDVAADLGHTEDYNHRFWKNFRKEVKNKKDDCLILAEHYGNPNAWLKSGEWDSVMNYDAFMEPVTWFFTGMEKHSDEFRHDLYNNVDAFWGAMKHYSSQLPIQSKLCAMNQLSNHDHSRFLTRTNHKVGRLNNLGSRMASTDIDKRVLMLATVLQMTWTGCPTIYYGDEAGLCGFTDPDSRRPYPWGNEDVELIEFFKSLIELRMKYKEVFVHGSLIELYKSYGFLCYGRVYQNTAIIVCINNSDQDKEFDIPVYLCGQPKDNVLIEEFQTGRGKFVRFSSTRHTVNKNFRKSNVAKKASRIFSINLN